MPQLDARTLKELNNAIKILSGTGKEISGKARELMTFIYAAQEGFLGVGEELKRALDGVSTGKFELPNLRKYLKSLQLTDDVIEDILDKRRELDKLDDDRIRSTKNYYKMLDLIYGLEEDRYNLSSKSLTAFEELNVQLINQHRLIKSIGLAGSSNTDVLNKQIQKHHELNKVFENEFLSAEEIKGHLQDIEAVIDNIAGKSFTIDGVKFSPDDAIKNLTTISEKQLQLLDAEDQIRRKKLLEFVAFASGKQINLQTGEIFDKDGIEIVGKNLELLKTHLGAMVMNYEMLISEAVKHGKITSEISDMHTKIIESVAKNRRLTQDESNDLQRLSEELLRQNVIQQDNNVIAERSLKNTTQNLIILKKYAPELRAAQTAANGLADKVEGLFDVIPTGLQKFLGLDDIGDNIRKSGADAIKVFNKTLIETGSSTKAINAGIKSWSGGIRTSMKFVGAFALILVGAFKVTKMLDEATKRVSEEMGISLLQAKKLNRANLDVVSSQENQFSTLKDIRAVQEAYIKSTGQAFAMTTAHGQHMATELSEIGKVFGYGSERAVELNETFEQLGANESFAASLQRNLGFMTEMTGLSPEMISHDLLESADILSTYFAGLPDQAAKTVIQVRRMGMSLKQAGDIAKSMLDLEGFMTDMFELAAMGGPDFSKAFDLGITGDIEGMTKEIMDSIGSVEAFGQMDFLQREKIAKTLGMSTAEINKSLLLREKMIGLNDAEKASLEANIDRMGKIEGMDQDAIKARLSQLQSTDRLNVAWDKIKATLIKSVLPIAEAFAKTLNEGSPILDTIVGGFKILGGVIKGVMYFISGMLKPLQWIGQIIGKIAKLFGKADHHASELNTTMASGVGITGDMLKILGTMAGAWYLMGKPLLKLISLTGVFGGNVKVAAGRLAGMSIGKSLFKGLGDITVRLMKMIGLTKLVDKGGLLGKLVGAAPTKEFDKVTKRWRDATTGRFVKAPAQKRGLVGRMIGKLTGGTPVETPDGKTAIPDQTKPAVSMGEKLANKIKSVGNVIKTTFSTLGEIISTGIKSIGEVLKSGLNVIGDIVGKIGDVIMSLLERVGTGVGNVIKSILKGIGDGLSSFSGKSLVGAAALVVLSGALYVTAKAVESFTNVNWGDMAKAGAALVGLTLVGAMLGSIAPQMIIGAIGLAAMGAALIPAAFALGMFADVKWDDLAKAGVAIIGLTAGVAALGAIMMSGVGAAVIFLGAAALAAMGAALLPLASAVKKFSDSNPRDVAGGLKMLSGAISEFDKVKISDASDSPIGKLKELATIANPLTIVSRTILQLGESISQLSNALENVDLSKLSDLEKFKDITSKIGVRMPIMGEGSRGVPMPPSQESTAQNVLIRESNAPGSTADATADEIDRAISDSKTGGNTKKLEALLIQMIAEIQNINKRPIVLDFGDGTLKKVNTKMKSMNNNG